MQLSIRTEQKGPECRRVLALLLAAQFIWSRINCINLNSSIHFFTHSLELLYSTTHYHFPHFVVLAIGASAPILKLFTADLFSVGERTRKKTISFNARSSLSFFLHPNYCWLLHFKHFGRAYIFSTTLSIALLLLLILLPF